MNENKIKGIVVAAPESGSGKTTFTLGLLAALHKRGIAVSAFKIGPDFIDPGLHARITGSTSRNLDGWMLEKSANLEIFGRAARRADMAVVEGVMGLYDGFSGASEAGSTAQMAKWLGLPVLLVADAGSMARSFAALVKGFTAFDPDCTICGVAANNVASSRHLKYLAEAMEEIPDIPLFGGIFRNDQASIPERHLGLFTAEDHVLTKNRISALASLIEDNFDLDRLIFQLPEVQVKTAQAPAMPAPVVRVAVARDSAFCFYYEDNLDVLRENGGEIVFFSPISDAELPPDIDGLYLGGGYPELYARLLSQNTSMRKSIKNLCSQGIPAYAECGGFMYLCRQMADTEGNTFDMTGVFPFETLMQKRLSALGYREVRLLENTPMGPAGSVIRGHEFHYSHIREPEEKNCARPVYDTSDKTGSSRESPGWMVSRCLGSYVHLHFRSQPEIGSHFTRTCRQFQNERQNKYEAT